VTEEKTLPTDPTLGGSAVAGRVPDRRQWIVLSVLVLAQLMVWRDNTMLNVALADTDGSGSRG
jgi:hypothetical protein